MILISDAQVLNIPIQENGGLLVDIKEFGIIVDDRKSKSSTSYSMARKAVVEKLLQAEKLLPNGIRMLVIEGHRPLSLQKRYFDTYYKELHDNNPSWSEQRIYDEASKFVAPPEIVPPHCTGGAVDVTLISTNGRELDLGTRVNATPVESDNTCFTKADNVSKIAQKNRQILIKVMTNVGFINYSTEWWHWSYGDRHWAYMANASYAIFGNVDPSK